MKKPTKPRHSEIGRGVTARRNALNLTQEQLAERLGIAKNTLANIEHGASEGNPRTRQRLAEFFGCTVSDLFRIPDPPADAARTRALERMAHGESAKVFESDAEYNFDFEGDDVSLADALALADAYRKAEPLFRAFAVSLLTADARHLAAFPAAHEQLPGLGAILKSLQRNRVSTP